MVPFFLRPSTRLREIDLTQQLSATASSIGCVIGEFHRGPLKATYPNSVDRFLALYGSVADPKLSYAHDTVQAFMTESTNCLVQRVVNNALHAGTHLIWNGLPTNGEIDIVPFYVGQAGGYETGVNPPFILEFAADLITANSFTMNVTDGVTVTATNAVVYATSNDNTLALIASAIQTALNSFGTGGYAQVLPEPSGSKRRIAIFTPPGKTLEYTSPTVTLGVTQAAAVVRTPSDIHVMTIMAENPSVWGNDIGFKITGRDVGVRQRIRLLFSAKLVTGNSFTATINDVALASPVAFTTDSDTTMAAIATALSAHAAVSTAYVEEIPAGRENDRSIIIVAETAGPGQLVVNSAAVTSGASQAAVTQFNILDGQSPDGSFVLEVYNRSNVLSPEEPYTVSLHSMLNSRGEQMRIDAVINDAANPSINIRVVPNSRFVTDASFISTMKARISNPNLIVPTTISWLAGGDAGLTVLTSQMRTAIQNLDDRVRYPFNILMNAGYTQVEVQQEMVALAKKRIDCIAVLDMPSNKQAAQTAREYRLYELNIDSPFGAIYTPDLLIADIATGERRYIPPSGYVGAVYAYNDRVASVAHAPAGLNRGILSRVLGLRVQYKPSDEELLFPEGINCIVSRPGIPPVIMGEETLQRKQSIFRSVHARRLVSRLEVTLVDGLDYVLFEPNTEFTRNQAVQLGKNFLQPYKNTGGLYDYRIQCNDDNNPPEIIDMDALSYRVFLKVWRTVKGIMLDTILTRTGASFDELEGVDF